MELQRLRRRRFLAHSPLCVVLVGALAFVGITRLSPALQIPAKQVLGTVVGLSMAASLLAALFVNVAGARCPRCGELFHMGPRYRNDLARRCLWCDLRLDGSNAEAPWMRRDL